MFENAKNIFISGIGGIGASGLARLLKARDVAVCGSDIEDTSLTRSLRSEGIAVFKGNKAKNIPPACDLLIYSAAVPSDNPERKAAKKLKIPEISYPEAVAELVRDYELIAVAGTNGKSTTTAMIAKIADLAGLDPSFLVGTVTADFETNARLGKSKYFILEADEYRRAFLNYSPAIAVITNIELDHLDYFQDRADIEKAFAEFISKIKPGGCLIYNAGDVAVDKLAKASAVRSISFALRPPATMTPQSIDLHSLPMPGDYNRENALAAAAVAQVLGIANSTIVTALTGFRGSWRRFERLGKAGKAQIISDYAHHPAALRAVTDAAVKEFGPKILAVFQPHQHNRTKKLFGDFVRVIKDSPIKDWVIPEIFDVKGRERSPDQNVSSADLVKAASGGIKHIQYASGLLEAEKIIRRAIPDYDAVILMGAGDIYKIAENLVND